MKRDFLENLGVELTKDTIDQIMAEYGRSIEAAKAKYGAEKESLSSQIESLNAQITQRDADLQSLTEQLAAAQSDAGKLADAQAALSSLQTKYGEETEKFQKQLQAQAYEFAVKTEAAKLKFTSAAAQRDFVRGALEKGMKLEGDKVLGFSDYVEAYKTADPGAFVAETPPADTSQPNTPPAAPPPKITLGGNSRPSGTHQTLAEMMRAKNENPAYVPEFWQLPKGE